MIKIKEIIRELNLKWNQPIYFVVDTITDRAVITNLAGLCWIASRKCQDIEYLDTNSTNTATLEHDISNELEAVGVYVEHLQLGDEITYQEINVVKTLNEFLGE